MVLKRLLNFRSGSFFVSREQTAFPQDGKNAITFLFVVVVVQNGHAPWKPETAKIAGTRESLQPYVVGEDVVMRHATMPRGATIKVS